jgi:hypothetical protein
LVLNDGEFRSEHKKGIESLGLGSKGDDPRSIGKFGLGMKSIFHLCEAFIYLASANQPASGERDFCDILNPWSGSGYHDEWDGLGSDHDLLIRTVAEWSHGASRWFCLWIPLRTEQQLKQIPPIAWPARPSWDEKTGRSKMAPEKGSPHAGASFSIVPAEIPKKGRLELKRAVFLPLTSTLLG